MPNSSFVQQGVIFGVLSILGWGLGDFFFAAVSRKFNKVTAFFWSHLQSSLLLLLFVIITGTSLVFTPFAIALSILAGCFLAIANLSFAQGLKVGSVSLVSPVAAGYSIVIVLAGIILFKETLTPVQIFAITLVVTGTILASTNLSDLLKSRRLVFTDPGIPYAFVTFTFWALGFLLIKPVVDQVSWIVPILTLAATQSVLGLIYSRFKSTKIKIPQTLNTQTVIFLSGLGSSLGYIGYSLGIERGLTSIVAPVSAAFPAVTILLAHLFFKEKLVPSQYLGIFTIIAGVILLST